MYKSSEHTAVRPASSGVQLPASPLVMTQETNDRQWDYHIRRGERDRGRARAGELMQQWFGLPGPLGTSIDCPSHRAEVCR